MGTDCNLYGQRGDGTTYEPPNQWDPVFDAIRKSGESHYFGKLKPAFTLAPPPTGLIVDNELKYLAYLKATLRAALMPAIDFEQVAFIPRFEDVLGIANAPVAAKRSTYGLIDAVDDVAKFWILKHKDRFNRPRAVQLAPTLDPPFCPGHASYPSGHAGESFTIASALVDALPGYPRLHDDLIVTARRIAFHREVAGVHYPSDSEAGTLLASQLITALRADAAYQAKVAQARDELAGLITAPSATRGS